MSNEAQWADGWHTADELAAICGCTAEAVETLAREHRWPRVHGQHGAKFAVELETVRQALSGTPKTVHHGIPPG